MSSDIDISFAWILGKIAPIFVLIALGFALRRSGWLSAEANRSLMRVLVNVFYPALILQFVIGNAAIGEDNNLWLAPAVGFGTICLGYLVAYAAGRLLRPEHPRQRATFAFTTGIYNYGYMPIPIVLALFADEGDRAVGLLLLHNVGVEAAFWTAGVAMLTAGAGGAAWKRLFNPPVIAMLVALSLDFSGAARQLPDFSWEVVDWLARCAIPIGIILSGATLADLVGEHGFILRPLATPVLAVGIRLGLLPVAFLLLARYLPWAGDDLRRVMVVQAAMPAGMFPLVVTHFYRGDTRTAAQVIIATTVFGLISIPLWIRFGLNWVF